MRILQRTLKISLLGIALLSLTCLAWAGLLRITGNFHAVEDGAVYRSAQLGGAELRQRIEAMGIRAVINLRGANSGKPWYDDELRVSSATGVAHIDFGLSAREELTDDEMRKLVILLRTAPRPLLLHCEAGADRSGLAAAIYKLAVGHASPEEAAHELSFRYGHFPWLLSKTGAMDRSFDRFVATRAAGAPDD